MESLPRAWPGSLEATRGHRQQELRPWELMVQWVECEISTLNQENQVNDFCSEEQFDPELGLAVMFRSVENWFSGSLLVSVRTK